MEAVFLQVIEMSLEAIWLILAIIVIRFILGKASKGFRYILWALVAIRLICPFTIESNLSLVPDVKTMVSDTTSLGISQTDVNPEGNQASVENGGSNSTDIAENHVNIDNSNIHENIGTGSASPGNNIQNNVNIKQVDAIEKESMITLESILPWIWITGGIVLLVYMILSYLHLWKKVQVSVPIADHTYICDGISSPFLLGILKPRIYVPSDIEEERRGYILVHEKEHLRCLDHVWKPLGFLILAVHWFNPFVWLAYILMCRDLELACDERVIRGMDDTEKRNYSETLLLCSCPRHIVMACPVAFGENGIKERIKRILLYKKPAAWIAGVAIVLCVIVGICFMTNPAETGGQEGIEQEDETESKVNPEKDEVSDTEQGTVIGGDDSAEDYEERVLYEATADLNHDGIDDKIQTVVRIYDTATGTFGENPGWDFNVNPSMIRVFAGKEDGTFETEACYVSRSYSSVHAGNGTVVLTKKDGKEYFMFSSMYGNMGYANYDYSIIYLGENGQELVVEGKQVDFTYLEKEYLWSTYDGGTYLREDVVPQLQKRMEPWIENGIILLALDGSTPIYVSTEEQIYPANIYYDQNWAKRDEISKFTNYQEAYKYLAEFLDERYQYLDSNNEYEGRYELVDLDSDRIPEFISGLSKEESNLYTYRDGRIYPLIKQGVNGIGDYVDDSVIEAFWRNESLGPNKTLEEILEELTGDQPWN